MKKFFKTLLLALMICNVASAASGEIFEDKEVVIESPEKKSPPETKSPAEKNLPAKMNFEDEEIIFEPTVPEPTTSEPKTSEPTENFRPVINSFAGDCALDSFLLENYWKNGAGYFLGNVKEIFTADDVTFVNLEGPLTAHATTVVKEFPLRGETKYVGILTSSSVELCNLANNHIYDCGDAGFADTVNLLRANGVKFCGEGYSEIFDVRGIKIGFLGYQAWSDSDYLREKISADIKNLRGELGAEIAVVEFHWGEELDHFSRSYQEQLAHFTADSGADIIVGAHPHVMQGVELYNGKIIAYSLGNFCFGANSNPRDKETFILQTILTRDAEKISVTPKIIPCRISSTTAYNDFCPTPVTGTDAEQILNHLKEYSKIYTQTINF
ncbi:MAG: CapA family protein [Selenomonadaceae bacterium]|nr:CapA family protein [Selenomonadaceae bacterium]